MPVADAERIPACGTRHAPALGSHGSGNDNAEFGGGRLEQNAESAGGFPRGLLVSENANPWAGCAAVTDVARSVGGMRATAQRLFEAPR